MRGSVSRGKEKVALSRGEEVVSTSTYGRNLGRGLVSREAEKVALPHGAKVVSTTTYGRNSGSSNPHETSAFAEGVKFLDSRRGTEEVFQGIQRLDAAINHRKTQAGGNRDTHHGQSPARHHTLLCLCPNVQRRTLMRREYHLAGLFFPCSRSRGEFQSRGECQFRGGRWRSYIKPSGNGGGSLH
jgi:hypothetical protein